MDAYALEAKEGMNKSVESLKLSLSTLRTGRASAAMLNSVMVDYWGTPTPVGQMSSISIPEPRQILIKPYDKNDIKAVVAAIAASDLGLNPINEGNVVRLIIPAMTEDRRKEVVKQAHKYAEECKVAIRNIRRDFMDLVKVDDSYSEDMLHNAQDDIQKVTDDACKDVDVVLAEKEKEIMAI